MEIYAIGDTFVITISDKYVDENGVTQYKFAGLPDKTFSDAELDSMWDNEPYE